MTRRAGTVATGAEPDVDGGAPAGGRQEAEVPVVERGPAPAPDAPGTDAGEDEGPGRSQWRTAGLVAGLTAVVAIPLGVALAVLKSPTWFPSVDLALIEMQVRDVATRRNPILGAGGRFEAYDVQGNHPGPLPYYVLAPAYRLFGASAWAIQVAAVSVGLAAAAAGIWLANRRAGVLAALATTLGYLLLILLYDPVEVLSPWNPNVAMLWWVTLLLALWGVLCRDYALLPVTAFAAALCAQAHVSYLGLAGGLAIIVAVYVLVDVVRNPPLRRQLLRWGLIAAVVELVLWAPSIYEQWRPGTGNLTILIESFTDPKDSQIPFREAWHIVLLQLDITTLFGEPSDSPGVPAWTLIVLWAASVAAAVWLRRPWLSRLHVVTAAAMATSFLAIVRITGVPWYYLMLWARGTALLVAGTAVTTLAVLGATLWSRRTAGPASEPEAESGADSTAEAKAAAEPQAEDRPAARRRAAALALRVNPVPPPAAVTRAVAAVTGVLVAIALVGATVDAADAEDPDPDLSVALRRLMGPTVAALDAEGPRDDKTLVTFTDPVMLGSSGFTMMLALERYGFDTYTVDNWRPAVGDGRVLSIKKADREVHVSVGDADIALWRADDDIREVAVFDPRTDLQRQQVRDTEAQVHDELVRRGLDDIAEEFDTARLVAVSNPDFPAALYGQIDALSALPQPIAVFMASEPGSGPPALGSGEPG